MTQTNPQTDRYRDEPYRSEEERQERLRRNTSFDPESKGIEELDPMHPDSWAGGSINPEAKKVARGETPANQAGGPKMPKHPTDIPIPTEELRPWAPDKDDEPGGRER